MGFTFCVLAPIIVVFVDGLTKLAAFLIFVAGLRVGWAFGDWEHTGYFFGVPWKDFNRR